ncbi:MAG: hypothetical protein U9N76_00130 [Candidatus Marinimicrobia bacterium]|nr:hypothetical protein [Candidatus Neomarinimicrobiota bacterium]
MKKSLSIFTIILVALMLYSCGTSSQVVAKSKNKRPAWMDDPHNAYPARKYLVAVGAGDTRQDAESIATGNLSRIFESKVKVDHTMQERYKSFSKGTKFVSEELATTSNENVNIQSDQSLVNVQFGESYTDKLARIHVIAYIERSTTARIYAEKINTNSDQILSFISKSETVSDPIDKYAFMNAGMIVGFNNQMLLDQMQVISPADYRTMNGNKGYKLNDIKDNVSKLARDIKFSVNMKNDSEGKVKVLLEEIISDLNFNLSNNSILKISGKISLESLDLQRGNLQFYGWELDIKMTNTAGDVLITIVEKGREGGLDSAGAKRNSIKQIGKIINKNFKKQLTGYFDGKVVK